MRPIKIVLSGVDVHSKKPAAAVALQVVPSAVVSNPNDAASFKSAKVQRSSNQKMAVKSSGYVGNHVGSSSSQTMSCQPGLPLSTVSEQVVPVAVTDAIVSASPSYQVKNFGQPMWMMKGLIAVVDVPLNQRRAGL
jgi:hypothetical protein